MKVKTKQIHINSLGGGITFISVKLMIILNYFYFWDSFLFFFKAQEAFECLKQLWDGRNPCILRNIEVLIRDIHLIGEQRRRDGSF